MDYLSIRTSVHAEEPSAVRKEAAVNLQHNILRRMVVSIRIVTCVYCVSTESGVRLMEQK
jgi:hypothetical protein